MSIDWNALAIPKGRTRKQIKARKNREDAKQLKAFRDACWKREADKMFGWTMVDPEYVARVGRCQNCDSFVHRYEDAPMTGEVHHRIYRGNKATRYDPNNGVLLCNHLVNNCHERAERKLIQV